MQSSLPRSLGVLTRATSKCVGDLRLERGYKTGSHGWAPLAVKKWNSRKRTTVYYEAVSYKSSYSSVGSEVPLLGLTMGQLVDISTDKYADREAFVSSYQNIRKTYPELKQEVDKLAAGFLALGLKRGDRIGIWSPSSYQWFLTLLAAGKAGLILVLVNPAYQANELEYCLKKVGMTAIIMAERHKTQDYYKMLASVVDTLADSKPGQVNSSRVPNLKTVIMLSDKSHSGTYKFDQVLHAAESTQFKELEDLQRKIQFDDPVNIQFTSGTTGSPKGATLSHHNIVNNAFLTGRRTGYHLQVERINLPMPLYHCAGCVMGALAHFMHGSCTVIPAPSFNAKLTAEVIEAERCTILSGTPTMFIDILNLPDFNKYNFSSLKKGIMGGTICPMEVIKDCVNRMNLKEISVGYGSTETSPAITMTKRSDNLDILTTVGTVMEHTEVKIVDGSGQIVPVGTPGELLTRGYLTMLGYWDDKEKTNDVITKDRWYKTGDQTVMDVKGYIKIVGRLKDLIIRGGANIYPKEIEEYLHTHPKIADVQVIGVPDARMGEEVCAWIKLKSQQTLNEGEVKEFCKGKLAHFKIPRHILFVDDFPKTAAGKGQKFKMVEQTVQILGLKG